MSAVDLRHLFKLGEGVTQEQAGECIFQMSGCVDHKHDGHMAALLLRCSRTLPVQYLSGDRIPSWPQSCWVD